jgi:hypothetical protein
MESVVRVTSRQICTLKLTVLFRLHEEVHASGFSVTVSKVSKGNHSIFI